MVEGRVGSSGRGGGLGPATHDRLASLPVGSRSTGRGVAVNGCCLTVCRRGMRSNSAGPETLALRTRAAGRSDRVNLERALGSATAGSHFVQGTSTPRASRCRPEENGSSSRSDRPVLDRSLFPRIDRRRRRQPHRSTSLPTGSPSCPFPHPRVTTLGSSARRPVNIETDILAKHVQKLLGNREFSSVHTWRSATQSYLLRACSPRGISQTPFRSEFSGRLEHS